MKKKIIPCLIATLMCVVSYCIGVDAGAATTLQEIKAYISSGITVKVNGQSQMLTDANGNRVYPIVYNGGTYLPVRAVAGLTGYDVKWVQSSQTVELTGASASVDLLAELKPYTKYTNAQKPYYSPGATWFVHPSDKLNTSIGGIQVDHWLCLYNRYATGEKYPTENVTASFNLEGKYKTLTFRCYTAKDTTLTIYGDNNSVLATYDLVGGQVPQTFTVDLMGTNQLSFVRGPGYTSKDQDVREQNIYCYIFDAQLK